MTHGMVGLLLPNTFDNDRYVFFLGTKNVAKNMKKISCGSKKTEGISWFVELSDKCKSSKYLVVSDTIVHVFRQKYKSSSVLLHEELCSVSNKA